MPYIIRFTYLAGPMCRADSIPEDATLEVLAWNFILSNLYLAFRASRLSFSKLLRPTCATTATSSLDMSINLTCSACNLHHAVYAPITNLFMSLRTGLPSAGVPLLLPTIAIYKGRELRATSNYSQTFSMHFIAPFTKSRKNAQSFKVFKF